MGSEAVRLGKVKFYDPKKEFGFARDLTISDYTENEDDVYLGSGVSAPHELVDGAYIVFRNVPSSKKPGTFKAEDVRPLHDYSGDLEPLIEEVASTTEREALRRYLDSGIADWQVGQIKFYDAIKGFGFIKPLKKLEVLNGDDAYVNEQHIEDGPLSDGAYVAFRLALSSRKPGQHQAVDVQTLEKFNRPSVSFSEDLAYWVLGGANLQPDVCGMAYLMAPSNVEEVLDLIETVTRGNEQRPERKKGMALRLLGDVLEKAEEEALLRSEWIGRIKDKYHREVRRLVAQGDLPKSVEALLWLEGLIPDLKPEAIDALVHRIVQDDPPDQDINLSYRSYGSKSLKGTTLRDVFERLSQDELADWVIRHTNQLEEGLQTESIAESYGDGLPLNGHLKVLEGLSLGQKDGNSTEDVVAYKDAIGRLAQRYHDQNKLPHEKTFLLWRDNLIDGISYSDFFEGYDNVWRRAERIDLLEKLTPKHRCSFAVRKTKELLEPIEDSNDAWDEMRQWLKDLNDYSSKATSNDNEKDSHRSLYDHCESVLQDNAREKTQVTLYGEGLLTSFPEEWLLQHASELKRSDLESVLQKADPSYVQKILEEKLDVLHDLSVESSECPYVYVPKGASGFYPEARWLLDIAKDALNDQQNEVFQAALAKRIDVPTHVQLYKDGDLAVNPESSILSYLSDLTAETIDEAQSWVEKGILEPDAFTDILHDHIQGIQVENRETARRAQATVRQLDHYMPDRLTLSDVSSPIGRSLVQLTRWVDSKDDANFQLPLLQEGLRWLSPEDQVTALRKAFYLYSRDQLTLTPDKLSSCSGFELDASDEQARSGSVPEAPPLGLSAELVIQTIKHVAQVGEFPREGYLIEIVRHVTRDDPARRVQLLDIFNKCEGRAKLSMTGDKNGRVTEVRQDGKREFIIEFGYDPGLVQRVKRLPSRRYDPDNKVWIVPAESETKRDATFQFARKESFFVDLLDDKHWTNNEHLVERERRNHPPVDVTYCEGRKAKRKDFGVYDFWWCRNEKCYASCHGRHEESNWESYTVEDFLALLDLNVDEDLPHDTIEMGQYHRFLGWINRFKQLLRRLYCRECGHILDASRSANYAHYRVTHFHCSNASCSKFSQEIYLHHCFNPQCGSVIDSRDSKQCPNGWWVCTNHECGACCSYEEMKGRIERLKKVGQHVPRALIETVDNEVGHLERAEHFCYKCGKKMEEHKREQFRCPESHVEYNLREANFDRPHRNLD